MKGYLLSISSIAFRDMMEVVELLEAGLDSPKLRTDSGKVVCLNVKVVSSSFKTQVQTCDVSMYSTAGG